MFGVVFPNRSFPIDISSFSQIDTFHWVLDMKFFVGKNPILSLSFLALFGHRKNKIGENREKALPCLDKSGENKKLFSTCFLLLQSTIASALFSR